MILIGHKHQPPMARASAPGAVTAGDLTPAAGTATTSFSPTTTADSLAKRPISNLAQASTSLSLQVRSVDDLKALAAVFAASGMFGRGQNQQQALATCAVQLMAGMEVGVTPFAAITGIYLVNGRPGFSAQLLAQAIKRHPRYDYRVLEKSADQCRIAFLQDGMELGVETFSMEMARRAGLVGSRGPWQQYPEAMLFARCLTAGMRTHCPDALGGHTPYTPEELGADRLGTIDENGMVVDLRPQPSAAPPPDRDRLLADALQVIKRSGLTAAGMRNLLDELAGPNATALGQLDDAVLLRLVRQGISPTTIDRWNNAADTAADQPNADEPADDDDADDDEVPMGWEVAS